MRRRSVLAVALTFGVFLGIALVSAAGPRLEAQPPAPAAPPVQAETLNDVRVIERVTQATERALTFLASKQSPSGGWDDNHAVNGLCCLAFMGSGHSPGRGQYRDVLEKAKRRLLGAQDPKGVFISPRQSHGPMYEHALVTLALAEMYGMDPDPKLESSLRRAVQVIVASQAPNGGWRYQPNPGDHDLSVTVMQIVALRAASNSEVPVPEATIDNAIKYVRSCYREEGGYGYQPGHGRKPEMTAAGVLSMQLLGKPDTPEVRKSLDYLITVPVLWDRGQTEYFFYFHYYAMQATYQAGGRHWNEWHPRIRELLLENQNTDGSWSCAPNTAESRQGTVGMGKPYWTAMSTLVLEVYMHYLPAYQR